MEIPADILKLANQIERIKMNVSWNTKKVKLWFEFRVYQIIPRDKPDKNGYYADIVTLQTGIKPTRAGAKYQAQKWVRYYRKGCIK